MVFRSKINRSNYLLIWHFISSYFSHKIMHSAFRSCSTCQLMIHIDMFQKTETDKHLDDWDAMTQQPKGHPPGHPPGPQGSTATPAVPSRGWSHGPGRPLGRFASRSSSVASSAAKVLPEPSIRWR